MGSWTEIWLAQGTAGCEGIYEGREDAVVLDT